MIEYETTILCPDSDAGVMALHERMADGWNFFCSWVEQEWRYEDSEWRSINHIALRRSVSTRRD